MSDTERSSTESSYWSKVELTKLLSILGLAYAVTYDVGFFWGAGAEYFSFFTLSEHIIFSLSALPFALGLLLMYSIGALLALVQHRQGISVLATAPRRIAIFAISGIVAAAFIGSLERALMFSVAGVVYLTFELLVPRKEKFKNVPLLLGVLMLIVAFDLGLTASENLLSPAAAHQSITLKNGDKLQYELELHNVSILRAGERGILFYDSTANAVKFVDKREIGTVSSKKPRANVFYNLYEMFK